MRCGPRTGPSGDAALNRAGNVHGGPNSEGVRPHAQRRGLGRTHSRTSRMARKWTIAAAVSLTPGHDAPSQARYTSEAMLAAEVEAMATVSAERERPIGGIGEVEQLRVMHSRDASGRTLDAEQKVAVEHLTSPGLHRALVAPAGAGKTFTIAQTTRAWQQSGQRVVVLGQQANTAKITADEIGQATGARPAEMTIAGFLGKGPAMSRAAQDLRHDLRLRLWVTER